MHESLPSSRTRRDTGREYHCGVDSGAIPGVGHKPMVVQVDSTTLFSSCVSRAGGYNTRAIDVLTAGWSSMSARLVHIQEVVGYNPTPATNFLLARSSISRMAGSQPAEAGASPARATSF